MAAADAFTAAVAPLALALFAAAAVVVFTRTSPLA